MNSNMQKLLEELNSLASRKRTRQISRRDHVFRKIRWWGYGLAVAFLIGAVVIGFGFKQSVAQRLVFQIFAVPAILLPTFVLIAEIVEGVLVLAYWREDSFSQLVRQIDDDIVCMTALTKYSETELKRAKQWIQTKIERDSWRLSLFGTDKISVLAALGLSVSGWAVYEKTQAAPFLQTYQMVIFFVLAFIAGAILGSILTKISHQRFKKMVIWIDLALFEKSHEDAVTEVKLEPVSNVLNLHSQASI